MVEESKREVRNNCIEEWQRMQHELDLERIKRLRPIDDDFMRCLFRDDLPLVQEVLRTITGLHDLTLFVSETQRDLHRLAGARSVELDVWGVDSRGGWHNIEIQRGYDPDPHRARYHSAAMDVEALDAGMPFSSLPEQWVIFIMEHDPFGEGAGTYLFERSRSNGSGLHDGTHILYANASYRADDELGWLMEDLCQFDPARMHTELLRKRVEYFKEEPEGVAQMCEIIEEMREETKQFWMQQGIEQGIEQGSQLTLLDNVRSMVHKLGVSAQNALEILDVPKADWARYLSML